MERGQIIEELIKAYAAELETVQNYIAASVNLDGVRSDVIKKSLAADVTAELMHAQQLAMRVKTIGGTVPGSLHLIREQEYLQPPKDTTDVVSVIKGGSPPRNPPSLSTTKSSKCAMARIMPRRILQSKFSATKNNIGASSSAF